MWKKIKLVSGLYLLLQLNVSGQDVQFTQFYAAPLYLNPGFAGSTMDTRVISNNRVQWTGLNLAQSFNTYATSIDHYIPQIKSGVGMLATYSSAGTGRLKSADISAQYAYHIDLTSKWKFRPGLQATFVSRSIDFNRLLFGDQIYKDGNAAQSQDQFDNPTVNFFDFSAGFLLYNKNLWIGSSTHHLNSPNQSLTGQKSRLPIKFSLHGGYKIVITNKSLIKKNYGRQPETSISPAFSYKSQGEFDQLDVGMYFFFEPLILGAFYRGIPLLKSYQKGYGNTDAIAALIGLRLGSFNFGYSYDITVSKLSVTNTKGSHEISLCYIFDTNKTRKKYTKRMPCPDFYGQ
jgi:type IX secretion system PorP/SprF family membrane protein